MSLKPPEFQICELFAANAEVVIDKKTIVQALGHDWSSYDLRHLDKLISRLRQRWETQQSRRPSLMGRSVPQPGKVERIISTN